VKHVFIVGCPRSGSTWTTFLLAQHPEVATFQHAKLFDYLVHMQRWHHNKADFSFIVQPDGSSSDDANLKLGEVLPEDALLSLLRHVAEGILSAVGSIREDASVVVDKTPENGHLADFILKLLPEAYFLHIERDPRSVFCSHRSASRSWARWEFPTQPVDGARFWQRDVEAAAAIAKKTERYLAVRYEDLKDKGASELSRILQWLDLSADEAFCERAVAASSKDKVRPVKDLPKGFVRKTTAGGWRDELSKGDTKVIEYVAGELMQELGYELTTQPGVLTALRVWLRETPEPMLDYIEKKLHRMAQLVHWRWVGRKLEWPEP
jgi:hypothetical protein